MFLVDIFLIVFCGANTLMGVLYLISQPRKYGSAIIHFSLGILLLYLGVSGLNI